MGSDTPTITIKTKTRPMKISRILYLIIMVCLASCGNKRNNATADGAVRTPSDTIHTIAPKHAKGFEVKYTESGMVLLDIHDPENNEKESFHYALCPASHTAEVPQGYTRINIPVKSVVCMTSLQLSNFIKLGATNRVVGITNTRHLHNATINQQLKEGKTHKIGIEGNFDNEVIMSLNPELILISPFKRGGYDAIRNTGVTLMPHLGYKELTPLGQAEWIKVMGLLIGEEASANKIYAGIEKRYNELKAMVDTVTVRPTVFSGEMRGGNWYAVGGKSFLAQMFRDAGAEYFLKDNTESGGVTLDYETVYSQAVHARYWRIVNSYAGEFDYNILEAQDKRYIDFDAWKNHGVIYCNMKQVPFYESMPVEPEVILADLIHVFHPEILPQHKPIYYRLLK